MNSKKISFLGLGVMGGYMAGHLSKAGHEVSVFDINNEKVDSWLKTYKGTKCSSPKEASSKSDIIMICVGDDNDIRKVMIDENGILRGVKPEAIIIDHTTASADIEKEMYSLCKQSGISYMDAPITGGHIGAKEGTLSLMAGGDEEVYNQLKDVFSAYAKTQNYFGAIGSGQVCKMANQIMIASCLVGAVEGLALAEKAGIDLDKVYDSVKTGSGSSWQFVNRAKSIISKNFEFGFAVDLFVKDLSIGLKKAEDLDLDLLQAKVIKDYYVKLSQSGKGKEDISSLISLLIK